jgi:transposase-like protein
MRSGVMSSDGLDEQTIELIARRVAIELRDELEAIAAELAKGNVGTRPLTVEDVAEKFGVARSTVYAHWREWGGYKLGAGEKTAIRFPATVLPNQSDRQTQRPGMAARPDAPQRARRRRRTVLPGVPRLPIELGDES